MGTLSIIVITVSISLLSVAFSTLSLYRLNAYIQAYRFEKSQYRPLFGLIHLRAVMWIYMLGTLLLAGFLVVFFLYLHR